MGPIGLGSRTSKRPAAHGGDVDLYVVTVVDADPDKRPGEFMMLVCRQGGNL